MTSYVPTTTMDRARGWLLDDINGRWHRVALLLYLTIVASHFAEHAAQIVQVYVLELARPDSGGLLGKFWPSLVMSEVLHTVWNSLQLTGLILLLPGFGGARAARTAWLVAIVLQSWHWFEHAAIQVQYVTGYYLYGAVKQMSILERFLPRIELHFLYNVMVVLPTAIAVALYLWNRRAGSRHGA
jgi:hypothetical protein